MKPNPYLPEVLEPLPSDHTRRHREKCGQDFYEACLELAQWHGQCGKPAQAILQLNKAGMVISEPMPYAGIFWYVAYRKDGEFLGNPVRHFQHLASRMSGANAEARSWRAWACFHLAVELLPEEEFPRDEEQMENEALEIPDWEVVLKNLPQIDSQSLPLAERLVKKRRKQRP